MNYFELYDLPLSLAVDEILVKNRYDQLIDKYRSDNSVADDGLKQTIEDEKILLVEEAYHVLKNTDETIRHVLELKKFLPDDSYKYSPQFKMEVRDIDEELMELELDENQEQLMEVEQKVNTLLIKIYEDVEPVIEFYKEDTATEETLLQVKDFYFKKKYLQRILDRINVIRNITSP